MTDRQKWITDSILERNPEATFFANPSFPTGLVGMSLDGRPVYSKDRCISDMGGDYLEATEYFEFNTERAAECMGEDGPVIICTFECEAPGFDAVSEVIRQSLTLMNLVLKGEDLEGEGLFPSESERLLFSALCELGVFEFGDGEKTDDEQVWLTERGKAIARSLL